MCGNLGANNVNLDCDYADVHAGTVNIIAGGEGVAISGGTDNALNGQGASISGGYVNTALGNYATISGGRSSLAKGMYVTNGGGAVNKIWSNYAAVAGGYLSKVSGRFSVVIGSGSNVVRGHHSLAVGNNVQVISDFAVGFGFGTSTCTVPYDNTIELCSKSLYFNGEEIELDVMKDFVSKRRLRESSQEAHSKLDELEQLVLDLEAKYDAQAKELGTLLSAIQ